MRGERISSEDYTQYFHCFLRPSRNRGICIHWC